MDRAGFEPATIARKTREEDFGKLATEYMLWLMREGYAETTIAPRVRAFKRLMRKCDIFDPESVKLAISKLPSESEKEKAVWVYLGFARLKGITFVPPRIRRIDKLPFIPLETEIDQLIAGLSLKVGAFLQTMKETGARPGEAWRLRWIDVDFARNVLTVIPEKGSNPRTFKVSNKLVNMLNRLPRHHERVFGPGTLQVMRRNYDKQRKRIAEKLGNPRIQAIKFTTLRHFKGTMEYHRTKDILHVQKVLGHKNIKNTLIYTQLLPDTNDEFVCKVAETVEEATELVELGFDYVTEIEGKKLFRKRK
jgi:integrase